MQSRRSILHGQLHERALGGLRGAIAIVGLEGEAWLDPEAVAALAKPALPAARRTSEETPATAALFYRSFTH